MRQIWLRLSPDRKGRKLIRRIVKIGIMGGMSRRQLEAKERNLPVKKGKAILPASREPMLAPILQNQAMPVLLVLP